MSSLFGRLRDSQRETNPFVHFSLANAISATLAAEMLNWLEFDASWSFVETSFYKQFEIDLRDAPLPSRLLSFVDGQTSEELELLAATLFGQKRLALVSITAHKLLSGHAMGVHNDFLEGHRETHRILLHLNRGWPDENGGFMLLHYGPSPEMIAKALRPIHRSVQGFEITQQSFHSVSRVHGGTRYTIVYTFGLPEAAR